MRRRRAYQYTLLGLGRLLETEEQTIGFLQEKQLLHVSRKCALGHDMRLDPANSRPRWRCSKCPNEIGLRVGTFFQGSRLPLSRLVKLIYCWANDFCSDRFAEVELNIGHQAAGKWREKLREVCADVLLHEPYSIGGRGLTVEIDESCFTKNKKRRPVLSHQWVLGGMCRETRELFTYAIPDRSAKTLRNVISDAVLPGTVIHTDCWSGYNSLGKLRGKPFKHLRVNHSKNFKDPISGSCTNLIEGHWNVCKLRNRIQCGTRRDRIESYLSQHMWRERNRGTDLFAEILKDVATVAFPLV